MADQKHLRKQWNQWYLQVRVPRSIASQFGAATILRPLGTTDLRAARVLRDIALGKLRSEFERLKADAKDDITLRPKDPEWLLTVLDRIREEVRSGNDPDIAADHALIAIEQYEGKLGAADVPAAVVPKIRAAVAAIENPHALTLHDAIEAYLKEAKERIRPQTYAQKHRRLKLLTDYFGKNSMLDDVSRADAGAFTSTVIQAHTWSVKTKKDVLSDYSVLWNFAEVRGFAKANPWHRMAGTVKASTRGSVKERAWTEAELLALLKGTEGNIWNLSVIALYSGMRREEIATLRVVDVRRNVMHVTEGKSAAAVREVPVHPILKPLLKQLMKSSEDGYVLSGLKASGENLTRGHYIGKRFGAAIRGLKLTGVRLHDLRRNYIAALEAAGVPESTTKLLVGHARDSMSYGRYSAGISVESKADAVSRISHGRKVDAAVARRTQEQSKRAVT